MSLGNLLNGDEDRPLYCTLDPESDLITEGARKWCELFGPKKENKPPVEKKNKPRARRVSSSKKYSPHGPNKIDTPPSLQGENEDGYPLKFCLYEPSESRQIYCPPGYGVDSDKPHCVLCHLKPCVAGEFHEETKDFMFDEIFQKELTIPAAQKAGLAFVHKKYCKLIKRRYLKKLQPPQCITDSCKDIVAILEATVVQSEAEEDNESASDE